MLINKHVKVDVTRSVSQLFYVYHFASSSAMLIELALFKMLPMLLISSNGVLGASRCSSTETALCKTFSSLLSAASLL